MWKSHHAKVPLVPLYCALTVVDERPRTLLPMLHAVEIGTARRKCFLGGRVSVPRGPTRGGALLVFDRREGAVAGR